MFGFGRRGRAKIGGAYLPFIKLCYYSQFYSDFTKRGRNDCL